MKSINLLNCSIKPLFAVCTWLAIVSSTSIVAISVSAQTAPNPEATSSKPRVTFFELESKQDFRFSFENFLSSALDGVADLSTTDSIKTNPGISYSSTSLPGAPTSVTIPSGSLGIPPSIVVTPANSFAPSSLPFSGSDR
jgi:hypothetical protein